MNAKTPRVCRRAVQAAAAGKPQPSTLLLEASGPMSESFKRWNIRHDRLPSCTWDTCFNRTRCGRCGVDDGGRVLPLRVHLLPHIEKKGVYEDYLRTLREVELVGREGDACISIGTFDMLNGKDPNVSDTMNKIYVLANGDFTVGERLRGVKGVTQEGSRGKSTAALGRAMVLTDNWVRQEFRAGFDLSWPMTVSTRAVGLATLPAASRRFFLTFAGSVYGGDKNERGGYRILLARLHDPARGVQVVYRCKFRNLRMISPALCAEGDERWRAAARASISYDDLLNSTFCLVPGGYHPGSGRLAEVLSAGCIPVLVGDDYVLPFNAVLDWSSLAFTVCATCVDDILPGLRAMPPDEVEAMRRNVVRAHRLYFTNQTARWMGVISTLSRRVRCLAAE